MNNEINYKASPLHGVSLEDLLIEIVDHYGFDILYAYLNINCFKVNPSIESSVKFLKKTTWAREKVEAFYMYEFKNLPRASSEQFLLPPRDRIIPEGQTPREPKELSLEDAERLHQKRANKTALRGQGEELHSGKRYDAQRDSGSNVRDNNPWKTDREPENSPSTSSERKINPWANAKSKSKR